MPGSTPELNLQTAVDADDNADYLTISLRNSLQTIDALYNSTTGHTHSGAHQGGPVGALGAGAIPDGSITYAKLADGSVTTPKVNSLAFDYTAFTPTANQGATSLTVTNIISGYSTVGIMRVIVVSIQFASAGSAGTVLQVRIPAAAATATGLNGITVLHAGTFIYTQTSGVWHHGIAQFATNVDLQFVSTNAVAGGFLGTLPSFTVASGDRIGIMLPLYKGG